MKISNSSFLSLIKLIATISVVLFVLYIIKYIEGAPIARIQTFDQDTLYVEIENQTFELATASLIKANNSEDQTLNFFQGFLGWIGIIQQDNINNLDQDYIHKSVDMWEQSLNFHKVSEGTIALSNGTVVATEPRAGKQINTHALEKAIVRESRQSEEVRDYIIVGQTQTLQPYTSQKDFKDLVQAVEHVASQPFTLTQKDFDITHTIPVSDLEDFINISFDQKSLSYQIHIHEPYIQDTLSQFTTEPKNAEFTVVDNYYIEILPSKKGIYVDKAKTTKAIQTSILHGNTSAEIFFSKPTEPTFTTEDAESLNISHLVSSFTTYYACCQSRVRNIKKFADIVDGTIIYPGETFNLNTFVGQRTKERGFEPAGTLVKGVLIETTGGGVSQFATTFFNAIYWGGFENISHTPHSRYFSRYPEGIEATISWPEPHLIFKNNTDSGLLIQTTYTDSSITVSFFGNNDGRIVTGDQYNGTTRISVIDEGGEFAHVVSSELRDTTEVSEPKDIYYVDTSVPDKSIYTKTQGRPSYSFSVVRNIYQKDTLISQDIWPHRYLSEDREFLVHSCEYIPVGSTCKTPEDLKQEKEELLEFYEKIENGL